MPATEFDGAAGQRPHRVGVGQVRGDEVGLPPAMRISATAASPRAASRPLTRTCAPRRASRTAAARPMPLVAPVTSVVCPARSISAGPVLLSVISFPSGTLTGLYDPQWQARTGLSNPICGNFGA